MQNGPDGTRQLREWRGAFGDEYTDRNLVDWHTRVPLLQEMLKTVQVRRLLEIGCNRGHNLIALENLLGPTVDIVGVEPNAHARSLARASGREVSVLAGDSYNLPFADDSFDLAMTWGVLIHIPLSKLPTALAEIHRVTQRYILTVEYFAPNECVIPYRDHDNLLWKRDFRRHFQEAFPELAVLREGFWGRDRDADNVTWWLFEKVKGKSEKTPKREEQ